MLRFVKSFIEHNIDLITSESWKTLFEAAYAEALSTAEMRELCDIIRDVCGFNSVNIRSQILYEAVEYNLRFVKSLGIPTEDHHKYLAQFLRYYLNNTLGFLEQEAIEFVYQNQANLGITLVETASSGQHGIHNYKILFDY